VSDEAPTFENAPPISVMGGPREPEPRVDLGAPPTIRVRHLWHRFGNLDVLRDVTFDVGPGEIFGFIGPNGAGKTTTIRVMATLLEPMAGRVEIDGIDVTIDPDEVRRRIGYMPDHAGVYERITVREYLEFFADAFRVPSLGVVDAVLELTDLGKIQDRIVATMSKGMKQRLQLGRILLHDPKVLILDEPASDLDPRARIEIRDLLLELGAGEDDLPLLAHPHRAVGRVHLDRDPRARAPGGGRAHRRDRRAPGGDPRGAGHRARAAQARARAQRAGVLPASAAAGAERAAPGLLPAAAARRASTAARRASAAAAAGARRAAAGW
jgi:ABC-2 type transport system ATP-binding protein